MSWLPGLLMVLRPVSASHDDTANTLHYRAILPSLNFLGNSVNGVGEAAVGEGLALKAGRPEIDPQSSCTKLGMMAGSYSPSVLGRWRQADPWSSLTS